ncbi:MULTISPECIES: dTDP-4-dehydrorhamnose reductase [unclassified Polaromonas]|uniref:dTDP-4-dehydrorhamnose reductase n=1 Tax=unclassified Polaromonas TaxID=2638319 RepID=UPI000F07B182|nr:MULTISPECIES: dTDP-4-dehydrorhamnose reductase [unclassified Polaromonas]AYQ27213.1 dTDP-4-dehydrorhamnose reductase [Polaromonas sp. SP1]QGJ17946.1 dTDP-4-dehydrorhamnose reductase [Polaromonas sp. Pch-P]
MKVLLFGKNGQVGWELQRSLAPLGELVALDRYSKAFCGDLANLNGIRETVLQIRPDVIVNAAAYTAVDKAESDAALAHTVNAQAPGVLAEAASAVGAWLVHYSTDYVFDGSGSKPWEEAGPVGPLSVYGRTKLEGEQRIAAQCAQHLVLRTSWVYAARGGNFAKTMLRLAAERDRLTVVDDQFGAPTGAELLADVTAHMLCSALTGAAAGVAGTYHVAAAGETSWHGYAQFVLDCAVKSGKALRASPDTVDPVPTSVFPTPAVRPHNSRLNTTKFRGAFGLQLPAWEQGVARMLAELN